MVHQPSSPTTRRPMAVKVAVVTPRRAAISVRWLWLIATLVLLVALFIAAEISGVLVLIR